MATFKYSEVLEGSLPELFSLFLQEAVKPFDNLTAGYLGSKQAYQRRGITVENEITGYEPDGFYQVSVSMPNQEYTMAYLFVPCEPGGVRVEYEEVFQTKKPVLALNHWLMSHLMKKSLEMKISRFFTSLQAK